MVLNLIGACTRTAPRYWRSWAWIYFITAFALRAADYWRLHPWTADIWQLQQIFSFGILIFVMREAIHPVFELVLVSVVVAFTAGVIVAQESHWPGSHEEAVMWVVGTLTLALGITVAIGSFARFSMHALILAAFLLLYSVLMLAGADYLTSPQLGIAWSILEIAAFGAWAITFRLTKTFPA